MIDHYSLELRPTRFHDAFDGAGEVVGLEVWEIKDAHKKEGGVILAKSEPNGLFRVSSAYLLLNTTTFGEGIPAYTLHFWIGSETPQNVIDSSVGYSTELHLKVGGTPALYREVEGFESAAFMAYFRLEGIEYLPLADSPTDEPRFFHIKGKREKRVKEISKSTSYITENDVFVLDAVHTIYVYTGKSALRYDFRHAMNYVEKIKFEIRKKDIEVIQVDNSVSEFRSFLEKNKTYSDLSHKNAEFQSYLTGSPVVLSLNYEIIRGSPIKLSFKPHLYEMKLVNNKQVEFEQFSASDAQLTKSMLSGDKVFILLGGGTGELTQRSLFVWAGNSADEVIKQNALSAGLLYMQQAGLPLASTSFQRLCETNETKEFRVEFSDWLSDGSNNMVQIPDAKILTFLKSPHRKIGREDLESVDVSEGGSVKVWRVEGNQRVSVSKEKYGHFYSKDCYVMLYKYPVSEGKDSEGFMTFYWLGVHSNEDDRDTTAVLARFTCDSVEGLGALVRVVEGHETAYFRRLFRGNMVMHKDSVVSRHVVSPSAAPQAPREVVKPKTGILAGLFKRNKFNDDDQYDSLADALALKHKDGEEEVEETIDLFVVKGTTPLSGYAVQVSCLPTSLNSVDYFILSTPDVTYLRCPVVKTEDDMNMAMGLSTFLSLRPRGVQPKKLESFPEGNEPEFFWTMMGGKGSYVPGYKEMTLSNCVRDPIMYNAFSLVSGNGDRVLYMKKIEAFTKSNLLADDVILVDVSEGIIVWVGQGVSAYDRDLSIEYGIRLNKALSLSDGRDPDNNVIRLDSGGERLLFTRYFPDWIEYSSKAYVDVERPHLTEVRAAALRAALKLSKAEEDKERLAAEVIAEVEAPPLPASTNKRASMRGNELKLDEYDDLFNSLTMTESVFEAKDKRSSMRANKSLRDPNTPTFSVDVLRKMKDGVNLQTKEMYLSDPDFESVFGCDRDEFYNMPLWKQHAKKKEVGIF